MAEDKPQRRLFGLLRRPGKGSAGTTGRSLLEENALWLAHERALSTARDVGEASQRIASNLAKQRNAIESASDRARGLNARLTELGASARRVTEVFERLGIVALNAGLEGARLGEGAGHSLQLVGDEIRGVVGRGTELIREIAQAATDFGGELTQLSTSLERTREVAAEVSAEATRAGSAAVDAERALAEISERLKKSTGSDPETIRAIADATEHARALVLALGALSGKVPRSLIAATLRPLLEPLGRLLDSDPDDDEETTE